MSGAKNCPETPRQKMIGMMYLVLTAMLALNVSANILDGFKKITDSMDASIKSTDARNGNIMRSFKETAAKPDGLKFREWLTIANAVKGKSDELFDYIENFKQAMIQEGQGYDKEHPDKLKDPGNLHAATRYAINEKHGEELKKEIETFLTYMTSADSKCVKHKMKDAQFKMEWDNKVNMYKTMFNTDGVVSQDGQKLTWVQSLFNEQPLASSVALLTKYQNDIRVAEGDMINFLFQQGGMGEYSFNKVEAVIIGDNGYYPVGASPTVRICQAAMDTTKSPEVYINGQLIPNGEYHLPCGAAGEDKVYTGYIQVNDHERREFTGHYTVFAPSKGGASVSNTDLDIVYQGWTHTFKVSAPGVQDSKVTVRCTQGGTCVSAGNGVYKITATGAVGSKLILSVTAQVDGKPQSYGNTEYRIKAKPGVLVKLMYNGGVVKKAVPAQALTKCSLTASYAGDILKSDFSVNGFKWRLNGATKSATSLSDPLLLKAVQQARAGDVISLSDFVISGGAQVVNPTIALTLQ